MAFSVFRSYCFGLLWFGPKWSYYESPKIIRPNFQEVVLFDSSKTLEVENKTEIELFECENVPLYFWNHIWSNFQWIEFSKNRIQKAKLYIFEKSKKDFGISDNWAFLMKIRPFMFRLSIPSPNWSYYERSKIIKPNSKSRIISFVKELVRPKTH